jgi:hypothetical protein
MVSLCQFEDFEGQRDFVAVTARLNVLERALKGRPEGNFL